MSIARNWFGRVTGNLPVQRQIMRPVDHRFAPSSPALPSVADKKIVVQRKLADLGVKVLQVGLRFHLARLASVSPALGQRRPRSGENPPIAAVQVSSATSLWQIAWTYRTALTSPQNGSWSSPIRMRNLGSDLPKVQWSGGQPRLLGVGF
jgi:hypothetical protein